MTNFLPASLLCDFYKTSHAKAYPQGTTKIYSTFTPRSNKYMPMAKGAVVFGIQSFIQKYLVEFFNENFFSRPLETVVAEYERTIKFSLGVENPDSSHIAELHKLGYLPVEIRALEEGTLAPIQVPFLTIENTVDEFYWLTNYLETILSTEIWLPMTSATFSYEMRKMLNKHAMKTVGHVNDVPFQAHDFSMRGMSSLESAMASGAGHLLSFVGTDTIPAIHYLEHFYGANMEKELIGTSIPATEHSVMTALTPTDGDRDEREAYKHLINNVFPSGLVSLVSDSYDFWKVIEETIPSLKEDIMNRDGKVVIRPDSGNPFDILCGYNVEHIDVELNSTFYMLEQGEEEMYVDEGNELYDLLKDVSWDIWYDTRNSDRDTGKSNFVYNIKTEDGKFFKVYVDITQFGFYEVTVPEQYQFTIAEIKVNEAERKGLIECLWDTFGGTVSEQGYKVLDSHIGAIYGDSITYELAEKICESLESKGFASTNVVFGVGSYTFQYRTRDSLGFAMKATYAEIDGKPIMLQKDPKTDSKKKSQRGKVYVKRALDGELIVQDGFGNTKADQETLEFSHLNVVFKDGKVLRTQTLSEIREILSKQ